jgi:hypothetical protein
VAASQCTGNQRTSGNKVKCEGSTECGSAVLVRAFRSISRWSAGERICTVHSCKHMQIGNVMHDELVDRCQVKIGLRWLTVGYQPPSAVLPSSPVNSPPRPESEACQRDPHVRHRVSE